MIEDDRQKNVIITGVNAQYDVSVNPILDGAFAGLCHVYPLRVQYEDTDAGGIVYHAQYLAFAERARSGWLRCLGIDQPAMLTSENLGFVARRIEIDFLFPTGLGAVLEVESNLLWLGGASLKLQQNIMNRENGHILARLVVVIGLVAFANGKSPKVCRLPNAIKIKFSDLVTSIK